MINGIIDGIIESFGNAIKYMAIFYLIHFIVLMLSHKMNLHTDNQFFTLAVTYLISALIILMGVALIETFQIIIGW